MTACLQTQCYFGKMTISNKNIGGYRYSFQGQEKDPETGKEAFQLRLWDGRIGRWLTTDPYRQYASPYVGMGNNPVNGTDPDGGLFGWIRAHWKQLWNGGEIGQNDGGKWWWLKENESYFEGGKGVAFSYQGFGYAGLGKITTESSSWHIAGTIDIGTVNFAYDTGVVGISAKILTTDLLDFKFERKVVTSDNNPSWKTNPKNHLYWFNKDGKRQGTIGKVLIEAGISGDYGLDQKWSGRSLKNSNNGPLTGIIGWTIIRANVDKISTKGIHFSMGLNEDFGAAFLLGGSVEIGLQSTYKWGF